LIVIKFENQNNLSIRLVAFLFSSSSAVIFLPQAFRDGNPATGKEVKTPIKPIVKLKMGKSTKKAGEKLE
jgi:hypothetical protein